MMSDKLSPAVQTFLRDVRFAVLATINADSTPHLSVVWYELQGDVIMMNTRRGRVKDRNLRRDPRASVCVHDGNRYVTLKGRVEIVDDPATAMSDIEKLAVRYDGEEAGKQQVRDLFSKQQRVTLIMTIERATAYEV
jgi:PPOX class probable F420-dependent enzyme